jgi:hypothetical protein
MKFRVHFDDGTSKEFEAEKPDDIREQLRDKKDKRIIRKIKRVKD